jgi:hypothetical protein
MQLLKPGILLMIIFWGVSLSAQKPTYWSFAIYYDQDYSLQKIGLKSLNRDRNYTMGFGLSITMPFIKNSFLMAPHYGFNKVIGKKRFNDQDNDCPGIINSIMLGNGTFTPDDLHHSYAIDNDRPYASLTYLQTRILAMDLKRYRQYSTTLSVGVIGLFLSREFQTAVHKSMNAGDTRTPRTPKGWNNQISNGGEPTLAYTYEEQRLLVGSKPEQTSKASRFGLELKHGWKYSLGYYTMADYGLNFRFGKINPKNWTYIVNPLGGSNNLTNNTVSKSPVFASFNGEKTERVKNKSGFEFYTFGSLRPTFMLYNALLNGQFKQSAVTIDFQDMRHLIFEFDGGVAVSIPCRKKLIEIKTTISGRSPEFKLPGRTPSWHYWGGVYFVISHAS